MKRCFPVLFLIAACLFPAYSATFRSNLLMQKLEPASGILESGYCLETDGSSSTLYLDSVPVVSTVSFTENDRQYQVETYPESDIKVTRCYSKGLLEEEATESPEGKSRTLYSYIDGKLAFITTYEVNENEPQEVVFYIRSAASLAPVAVRRYQGLSYISDSFIYQEGRLFEELAPGLVVEGTHEVTEDGLICYEQAGTSYTYSASGLLLEEANAERSTQYQYEDGILVKSETVRSDETIIVNYENGKAVSEEVFADGVLATSTVYKDSGNVQTVYSSGRTVAVVYFKTDNRTIDHIEYN